MIQKIRKYGRTLEQRLSAWLVAVCTVTSNVSAILPKVIVIVGLLIGLGVVIGLIKKHARPS